ncbi:hypothetical protein Q4Q34_11720 [Flavivirga abyssicola]|uniref:hypothetical protein n=1 Tax=Flavivirga abyssicola TaxID=3063533 RepID=UPI0026E07FB2|nr:hypothetical protein [Flavivirga sp. MEBiC07777]WVK11894.1 hypothetical protein Q4Q34_11720 [Flavivirga sp. MEBiC07777]
MKKIAYSIMLLFCMHYYVHAQVGIGTTSPTAELEIETSNTGIPALELNPQSTPTGSVTGQLAVIGDKLFMYDATRGKWLSSESYALQFSIFGGASNQTLWYGGGGVDNIGPLMPFNGTIVYMTINSSGGQANKAFDIRINGSNVGNNTDPTLDGRVSLSSGTFSRTSYNIDFNAGDHIQLRVRNNGASDVDDPVGVIWVKWRQ